MEHFNLLDLDNDILNIIGDYVKADNNERDFQYYMVDEIGKNSIKLFKIIKDFRWKNSKRIFIINYFYINNIRNIETIDRYLTLLKLNLNEKNILFLNIVLIIYKIAKKLMMKI